MTAGSVTRVIEFQYDELGNPTRALLGGVELERNEYLDPRPHAISANLGGSFSYDDRGRLHQGADRTIEYTNFDLPRQITTGAGTTRFDYNAAGVRVRKEGSDGGTTTTIGGLYERRTAVTKTEHLFMVSEGDGLVAQIVVSEAGAKLRSAAEHRAEPRGARARRVRRARLGFASSEHAGTMKDPREHSLGSLPHPHPHGDEC